MKDFENYLVQKNDEIDNAAFDLINALQNKGNGGEIEWSMEIIGEVTCAVEALLAEKYDPCHPFHSDDSPCYMTDECKSKDCPFKTSALNYKEYEYEVSLCGAPCAGGTIKFGAFSEGNAYERAMSYVGETLAKAFPGLSIDYSVECVNPND